LVTTCCRNCPAASRGDRGRRGPRRLLPGPGLRARPGAGPARRPAAAARLGVAPSRNYVLAPTAQAAHVAATSPDGLARADCIR
jgi:hypothetical protein